MRGLVILALIAHAVGAEDLDELSARLKKTASAEYAFYATEDFTEEALAVLAGSPRHTRIVCEAAAIGILRMLDSASARTGWTRITEWCERLSERCRKAAPKDPFAMLSQAGVAVLRAHLARAYRGDDQAHWSRAADFYIEAHITRPEQTVLIGALSTLKELGRADLRLKTTYELGRKLYPDNPYFHVPVWRRRLKSLQLAPRDETAGLRKLVEGVAPIRNGKADGWVRAEAVLLHNDVVRLARTRGIKAPYITREVDVGVVRFDVPVGKHWRTTDDHLVRYGPGNTRRAIETQRYIAFREYDIVTRDGPVRGLGSAAATLARMRLAHLLGHRVLGGEPSVVWLGKPEVVGPVARKIAGKNALYLEVSGKLRSETATAATPLKYREGAFLRFRCWMLREKHRTVRIEVAETKTQTDAEFEEVLSSMRTEK